MYVIIEIIAGALDAFENGSADEKEDAKTELSMNYDSYVSQLSASGEAEAKDLLSKLEALKGQL